MSPAAAASEPRIGEPSQPASSRPLRRGEELRRAGTGAGGGAGCERSREHRGCTDKKKKKKPRMAGGRSTVTSLLGQSTDLTAPQREDIR